MIRSLSIFLLTLACLSQVVEANPGKPVAVRWWGQGMVSIETYWNLQVVIDPFSMQIGYDDPQLSGDLVLVTHEHRDHNNVELVLGTPQVIRGLETDGSVRNVYHVLDRFPDEEHPSWRDARLRIARTPHAIEVTCIPAWHDADEGRERGATAMFLVEVDGVRIVHCGDLGQTRLTPEQIEVLGEIDLLLIPVGGKFTVDGQQAAGIVRQIKPRSVIPIHYKTPALTFDLKTAEPFIAALKTEYEVVRPVGNTFAIRSEDDQASTKRQLVVLQYQPWKMPPELAELFARKEAANRASQQVFAALSANQMNHRPSDGTHTPRWNTEHMMGRELGFFSEIYAELDPAITTIDLNPAQMPPDYKAANPNWSGAEEARQMERTAAFTRRFSYLLDGLDLDQQAPGSRWTPRGLLEQMHRHYGEHTANVKNKFDLPDWPQQ